jgi:hypothetical protein
MELRRFTDRGLEAFSQFLDSCTTSLPLPWPQTALTDPGWSEPVGDASIDLEDRAFESRFELAAHLHTRFEAANFRPSRSDRSLWAWIACRYFREICPRSRTGDWQPGAMPRWIPQSSDWRRYYRHLVAGPYFIYIAHRDNPRRALALLCQKPGRPGDLVEQLASRQQIVTNPAIMEVATDCFVDPATGQQRRSANSKGGGGPRRFVDVLNQFDVTWDLSYLTSERLRAMLPREFDLQPKAPSERAAPSA